MSHTPTVSVVTATYNYGRYLAGAIDSALAQTFPALEVVVVDDGSTDDTPRVLESYAGDPRVRHIRTENRGQPAALNAGIALSRGDFVAILDADDLWLPGKVQKQIEAFQRNPDAGVVYTRRQLIDPEGSLIEYAQPELYRGDVFAVIFRTNFVCFSSSMMRRKVLELVGPFNELRRTNPDYDYWVRAAKIFQFDYVDEPLVRYRVGHVSNKGRGATLLEASLEIMRECVANDESRLRLGPSHVRRCFAETYAHRGMVERDRSRARALDFCLRGIAACPTCRDPWRELVAAAIPESGRRLLRLLLGRPVTWQVPRRLPAFMADTHDGRMI